MKPLKWNYDNTTAYWATRLPVPIIAPEPYEQYNGTNHRMVPSTWQKHILDNHFPIYCDYPGAPGRILPSPPNIIRCFQDRKVLEALVLIIDWGSMTRSKGKIYTKPNKVIEEVLLECIELARDEESVESPWELLTSKLGWSSVITSKSLHFLARSLKYDSNPPVPIDKMVMVEKVWPQFQRMVMEQRAMDSHSMPQEWAVESFDWESYNRFMTAINCWASLKGWTTTQLENTIFAEYHPQRRSELANGVRL